MSSAEPAIEVVGVSKRFRLYRDRPTSLKERFTKRRQSSHEDFWALRDVSLTVPRGSSFGLIGHNGSGKSTLLRLMAGIHRPTTGSVTARGRISALLELGAGFHPELTGRENVYLNGSILGLSRRDLRTKIDEIIEFAGLEEFADSPVKIYSSGMYVRLGFSVAVHVDPELLLIDEVIAVGDEDFQRRCFDHLYKLRRAGTTVVLVTHSLGLIERMCDHGAWLDHGVLQLEGAGADVVQKYMSRVNAAEKVRLEGSAEAAGAATEPTAGEGEAPAVAREAVIEGVELFDGDGEPTTTARSGEALVIRVRFRAFQPIDEPVVGLGFFHEGGAHLAGPNTRHGGTRLGLVTGERSVDYAFDALPLLPGTYRISAAVADWSTTHLYDHVDEGCALHVQPGSVTEQYGFVTLGGQWELPPAAQRQDTDER